MPPGSAWTSYPAYPSTPTMCLRIDHAITHQAELA